MSLRVYDTLEAKKIDLEPMEPGKIGLYVCGPTVQNVPHLGHARCYTTWDVVVRYLRFSGFEVTYVRNYTDIDDKIIKMANEEGTPVPEFVARNIVAWEEDLEAMGLLDPDVKPKVTEHIPEIIALTEALIERGLAYEAAGDVYFSVRDFPRYGRLSKRDVDDMRSGARVDPGEQKRDPLDFALWKAAKPGEPEWESPWGKGRPGWHIECSAMSSKYLGETFDIHAGGHDLIFPHHENEIAQSLGGTDGQFARRWMHNGFVNVDSEKMSKSLGNFRTVRELLEEVDAEVLKWTLLSSHYRSPLNFTPQLFDEGKKRVRYHYETLRRVARARAKLAEAGFEAGPPDPSTTLPLVKAKRVGELRGKFVEAMDDDFNTAGAFAVLSSAYGLLNELCDAAEAGEGDLGAIANTLMVTEREARALSAVLGLFQAEPDAWLEAQEARAAASSGIDAAKVEALIAERLEARANKDWGRADAIRDELKAMGVVLKDGPNGTEWSAA
ncbi:MAG: cysteine--tRNA ligase [Deltaproteobacteria bacterium]|nr:cysteine--tRNA ligase [Deltaproteobacteria bacterium]